MAFDDVRIVVDRDPLVVWLVQHDLSEDREHRIVICTGDNAVWKFIYDLMQAIRPQTEPSEDDLKPERMALEMGRFIKRIEDADARRAALSKVRDSMN